MTNEEKLDKITELVDLYFSPWGAAKGAMWESLTQGAPFTAESLAQKILAITHDEITPEESREIAKNGGYVTDIWGRRRFFGTTITGRLPVIKTIPVPPTPEELADWVVIRRDGKQEFSKGFAPVEEESAHAREIETVCGTCGGKRINGRCERCR